MALGIGMRRVRHVDARFARRMKALAPRLAAGTAIWTRHISLVRWYRGASCSINPLTLEKNIPRQLAEAQGVPGHSASRGTD